MALTEVNSTHERGAQEGSTCRCGSIPSRANREVVPHGFRSTFKDWATDWATAPDEIVEAASAVNFVEAFRET